MTPRMQAGLPLALLVFACQPEPAPPPSGSPSASLPAVPAPQPSPAAPISAAELAASPLIVFLGDSITAGYGLPQEQAYPALVQAHFAREGRLVRIVNSGVSGDTSAGGLERLPWMLKQKPDVVVVALGANDGLRGLPVDAMEKNLRAIVGQVQASGAKAVLTGMLVPPNYGGDYARLFGDVFPRVARDLGAAYVPFLLQGVGGVSELNQADGIHPNAAGQQKLAENVLAALQELLPAK